jgi:hypothetical protein
VTTTWHDCHALLDMTLDLIDERREFPDHHCGALAKAAYAMTDYPAQRWTPAGTLFAREVHHMLDGALRCDGAARAVRVAAIVAALQCKHEHQDAFQEMAAHLRTATVAFAAAHHDRLDPDTADPLASLYDALTQFQPRLAKIAVRELLRRDKYMFQRVVTNDDPTLMAIGAYLARDAFAAWEPIGELASCGATAQGHPARYTWYLDDQDA